VLPRSCAAHSSCSPDLRAGCTWSRSFPPSQPFFLPPLAGFSPVLWFLVPLSFVTENPVFPFFSFFSPTPFCFGFAFRRFPVRLLDFERPPPCSFSFLLSLNVSLFPVFFFKGLLLWCDRRSGATSACVCPRLFFFCPVCFFSRLRSFCPRRFSVDPLWFPFFVWILWLSPGLCSQVCLLTSLVAGLLFFSFR